MVNPQDIIKEIIHSIYDDSGLYTRQQGHLPETIKGMYDELAMSWQPLQTQKQLETILSGTDWDLSDTGFFLYLEPLENMKAIPIMTFHFNFSTSIPEFRLQLVVFLRNSKDEIVSVGYRFETPEGEGGHDFYHAQPIKAVRTRGQGDLPSTPDWLPDDYPTFPMDASDPVALLITLLVSLYNYNCLARLYGRHYKLREHLAPVMHLVKPRRSYWEVTIKDVDSFFCMTALDKKGLTDKLEKDYRAKLHRVVKVGLRETNLAEFKTAGNQRTI